LVRAGVTFLSDERRPGGVTLAFTERTGGVSEGQWDSLNLGSRCGDDPAKVRENRRRALVALGAGQLEDRLVVPNQVHGDRVLVVDSVEAPALDKVRAQAEEGADAIVCTASQVPVLLCFADCVPVVLAARGGFAVVHSGWRGTIARISAKALGVLCDRTGVRPDEVNAYVGPHVGGRDYEVSQDLLDRFVADFGPRVRAGERRLDLGAAVAAALTDVGADPDRVLDSGLSTPREPDRFYSYRAQSGACGRHGALAVLDI
jgi:hypothetical protein